MVLKEVVEEGKTVKKEVLETADEAKERFIKSINSYWPDLDPEKLQEDYVGIRPKIQKKSENMKDFIISGPNDHNLKGFVNLQGIESPGVTSSLAIAKYVGNLVM